MIALSRDVEIHIGLDRVVGEPRFDRGDEEALGGIARGRGAWARRLTLLHGGLEGRTPPSHRGRERRTGAASRRPPA